jgi:hypothetical protein
MVLELQVQSCPADIVKGSASACESGSDLQKCVVLACELRLRVDLGAKVGARGLRMRRALAVRSRTCACVRRGDAHGKGCRFFNPAYGC